jgi:hypothetical protein
MLVAQIALAASAQAAGEASVPRSRPWFDVRALGARGDGVADDTRGLQAALDAARMAGGGVVYVPAGTYLVAPPGAAGGRATLESLTIGSNTWLRGDGPATVLKVKAGAGSYRSLLSNHPTPASLAENVVISDLRFDQSCATSAGDIRPRPEDRNHHAIYLSWAAKNVTIERVTFDPICGVSTVVLNAPSAQNLVVRDNHFRFMRGPSSEPTGYYDNTAVYLNGQGTLVSGNLFESTAADGARGAIELHGARGVAANNVTHWYHSCVRAVGTSGSEVPPRLQNGFTIDGNTCADAKDAINLWSITGHHLRGVTITGNTISLAEVEHLRHTKDLKYFQGISFAWDAVSGQLDGDISDVVIEGNVITAQPSQGVWGASAYSTGGIVLTNAGNISNVLVRGNVLREVPTKAIHVESKGRGTMARNVRIEGNAIIDPGHDMAAGDHRAGIVLAGKLQDVEVAHNTITGTMLPFRGRYAIRAAAAPGSARVGIHDNTWSTGDPSATYQLSLEGAIDGGPGGRTRKTTTSPRPGEVLTTDAAGIGIWEVTVTGGSAFTVRAPANATPGQRLTIRIRNGQPGPIGPIRWEGFKMGDFTSPRPGYLRALEVLWDGTSWCELYQSSQDVPN